MVLNPRDGVKAAEDINRSAGLSGSGVDGALHLVLVDRALFSSIVHFNAHNREDRGVQYLCKYSSNPKLGYSYKEHVQEPK